MGNLDETNFREWAQRMIEQYVSKGMVIDSLVWARIIGLYNEALDKKEKKP
jgi:hypothetical protein